MKILSISEEEVKGETHVHSWKKNLRLNLFSSSSSHDEIHPFNSSHTLERAEHLI